MSSLLSRFSSPSVVTAALLLLVLFSVPARAQIIFNVNSGGFINDATDDGAGGVNPGITDFTFTVPNSGFALTDVNLRLAIIHASTVDLSVHLISPLGTDLVLLDAAGDDFTGNFQDTYLNDSAAVRIGPPAGLNDPPFAGPEYVGGMQLRPQEIAEANDLSLFNGQNPAGTWTLRIVDNGEIDAGFLLEAGDNSPWRSTAQGGAIGTQLIITLVPEPHHIALAAGLALLTFAAVRRKLSRASPQD